MNIGRACRIVKDGLLDDTISDAEKVRAIQQVTCMETHNSIKKDEIICALLWIFDHYDFEVEEDNHD